MLSKKSRVRQQLMKVLQLPTMQLQLYLVQLYLVTSTNFMGLVVACHLDSHEIEHGDA
jgi:hypothetical protein